MNKGPKGELRRISITKLDFRQIGDQYLDNDGNVWVHTKDCECCKGPIISEVTSAYSALTRGRRDNTLFCHICIPIIDKVRVIRKLNFVE